MPLDVAEFNSAFSEARYRVRNEGVDASVEQARLRELVPDDASAEDREWALGLIDLLGQPEPPPRQWSPLYQEAGEIAGSAYYAEGTVEEQIAAIADARRRIWEIADRADGTEDAHIRAMTRTLEHLEEELRNPTWPTEDPPQSGS